MGAVMTGRQQRILELLDEQKTLKIPDLARRLGVSPMTVHRDLNHLAAAGLVMKYHGGAALARETAPAENLVEVCALCRKPVQSRTAFLIYTTTGAKVHACCPHCGLLLHSRTEDVDMALTVDFLNGQMVNIQQAWFLVESAVTTCCSPSILSFAGQSDAQRFQRGFGGQVMRVQQAEEYIRTVLAMNGGHPPAQGA